MLRCLAWKMGEEDYLLMQGGIAPARWMRLSSLLPTGSVAP